MDTSLEAMRSPSVATIVSLQVGRPVRRGKEGSRDPREEAWTSGIFKDPVEGPVALGRLLFEGDGQADLRVHGGPD